jgi:hypothetical protein
MILEENLEFMFKYSLDLNMLEMEEKALVVLGRDQ